MTLQDKKDCGFVCFWFVVVGVAIGAACAAIGGVRPPTMPTPKAPVPVPIIPANGHREVCGPQCRPGLWCCCQLMPTDEPGQVAIDCDRCWCPE
jgi:hypothetical protein